MCHDCCLFLGTIFKTVVKFHWSVVQLVHLLQLAKHSAKVMPAMLHQVNLLGLTGNCIPKTIKVK